MNKDEHKTLVENQQFFHKEQDIRTGYYSYKTKNFFKSIIKGKITDSTFFNHYAAYFYKIQIRFYVNLDFKPLYKFSDLNSITKCIIILCINYMSLHYEAGYTLMY